MLDANRPLTKLQTSPTVGPRLKRFFRGANSAFSTDYKSRGTQCSAALFFILLSPFVMSLQLLAEDGGSKEQSRAVVGTEAEPCAAARLILCRKRDRERRAAGKHHIPPSPARAHRARRRRQTSALYTARQTRRLRSRKCSIPATPRRSRTRRSHRSSKKDARRDTRHSSSARRSGRDQSLPPPPRRVPCPAIGR